MNNECRKPCLVRCSREKDLPCQSELTHRPVIGSTLTLGSAFPLGRCFEAPVTDFPESDPTVSITHFHVATMRSWSSQYVEYSVYPCFNLGPIYSPNRGRRQVSFPAHNGLRALLSERLTCRGSSCSDPGQPQHRCPVYHEMAEAFFQFMFDARSSSFRYTRGTGIGSHPISDKRAMGSWSLLCAVVLILPATLHR